MVPRFIDQFPILLLDMGNTFMFGCDRFGNGSDYFGTYRRTGGRRLDEQVVSSVIDGLFHLMKAEYCNPAQYGSFGTAGEYLRRLPVAKGLPPSELEILEGVFARHEVGEIPGSHVRVLNELSRTHTLGVVSNIWAHPKVFEAEFRRVGILPLFATLVWSSEHGCIKPSPRIFLEALNRLEADPAEVLYVGDNPNRDIAGAKGVGMRAAYIENAERPLPAAGPKPDLIIRSLGGLLDAPATHKRMSQPDPGTKAPSDSR